MAKNLLHILVADDDRPYCIVLRKTLTSHGHSVVICNSGEEALDCLQEELFDIVLLDYKMGGISGIDVLQWMFEKKIRIPVIMITGHGSEEVALDAWKWRAEDYIIKGASDISLIPNMVLKTYKKWVSECKDKSNNSSS